MSEKLKTYFEGSLAGRKMHEKNYKAIITALRRNGCSVSQFVFKNTWEDKESLSDSESKKIYKKILKQLSRSDFITAELTFGSPGVTMIIQDAIHRYKKPVLILVHESKKGRPGVPFTGNPSRLLNIETYSLEKLDEILKNFIKKVKSKIPSSKFTVRLDEELDSFLEHMKLKLGESSKNQTILTILRQSMKDEKGHKKFR